MSRRARPATTLATGIRQDPRLAVAYVLLELVVVPLVVLFLALSSAPGDPRRRPAPAPAAATSAPATPPADARALSLPPQASEAGAVLLADPGRQAAR